MNPLKQFDRDLKDAGIATALENLAGHLIREQQFHELFELRKVQLRERLGLPVDQWQPIDDLPPELGRQLEEGLLEICREVGTHFFRAGDAVVGWSYLEPTGDKRLIRELLAELPVTDETVEAIIHISIDEGMDPVRGYQLVLERFGTCNAITTFETRLAAAPLEVRRGAAARLVAHVYRELLANIRRTTGDAVSGLPAGDEPGTLREIMARVPELTAGLGHHIDTTHLASTIRYSRILTEPDALDRAIELAEYGLGLHSDFHYRGLPPFEETYPDALAFLKALTGVNADAVIDRLARIADGQSKSGAGDAAAWSIYLLDALDRGAEALDAWLKWLHVRDEPPLVTENILPTLSGLVCRYGLYDEAATELRRRGDVLQLATILTAKQQAAASRR